LFSRLRLLERKVEASQTAGGGGTSVGMEARIAKLEASVEHIQADVAEIRTDFREVRKDIAAIRTVDFRALFGTIIAATLGLAAVMAHGFHWI
jgi:hypothetical protein